MEEDRTKPPFWQFAKMVMSPDTDEEKLREAARNIEGFMTVMYRICDRLAREEEGKN